MSLSLFPNSFLSIPRPCYTLCPELYELFKKTFPEDQIPIQRSTVGNEDCNISEYLKFINKMRLINYNKELNRFHGIKSSLLELRRVCEKISLKNNMIVSEDEFFSTYLSWLPILYNEWNGNDNCFEMNQPFFQSQFGSEFNSLVPSFKCDTLLVVCKDGLLENVTIFKQIVIGMAYSMTGSNIRGIMCDGKYFHFINSDEPKKHDFEMSGRFKVNTAGICTMYALMLHHFAYTSDDKYKRKVGHFMMRKISKLFHQMYLKMKPIMVDVTEEHHKILSRHSEHTLKKNVQLHKKLSSIKERSEGILREGLSGNNKELAPLSDDESCCSPYLKNVPKQQRVSKSIKCKPNVKSKYVISI